MFRNPDEYFNLDARPLSVDEDADFKVRCVIRPHLRKFFNGFKGVEQVKNLTDGKIYHVVHVECLGDLADFTIIDDAGEKQTLAASFFEPIPVFDDFTILIRGTRAVHDHFRTLDDLHAAVRGYLTPGEVRDGALRRLTTFDPRRAKNGYVENKYQNISTCAYLAD